MLAIGIEKRRKRMPFLTFCLVKEMLEQQRLPSDIHMLHANETLAFFQTLFGGRMGEELAGGGARLGKRKYIIELFIFTVSNAFC